MGGGGIRGIEQGEDEGRPQAWGLLSARETDGGKTEQNQQEQLRRPRPPTCGCRSSLHSWATTAASPSARMAEQLPVTCRLSTSSRSTITLRLLGVCVGGWVG